MPFVLRPFRRFPVHCSVTYNPGPFLKLPPAYFSGLWLLITLLSLSSVPAYAEWVAVGSSESAGGYTVSVDRDTIRRKGDLAKMWELIDYKKVGMVGSSKGQREYDCTKESHRMLETSMFSGHMGSGNVVFSNSDESMWQPVESDNMLRTLWKVACNK